MIFCQNIKLQIYVYSLIFKYMTFCDLQQTIQNGENLIHIFKIQFVKHQIRTIISISKIRYKNENIFLFLNDVFTATYNKFSLQIFSEFISLRLNVFSNLFYINKQFFGNKYVCRKQEFIKFKPASILTK